MKKRILVGLIAAIVTVSLTACGQTDVVGAKAKTSFQELIEADADQVTEDEMNGGWSLNAPDSSARFIWSNDYSKSPLHDIMLEMDATPFLEAGLDVTKLPDGVFYDNKLILGKKLGQDNITYSGKITPVASFNSLVDLYRSSIGYHEKLDHYGVDLGNGNKFEWAKDMSTNDKDMVFIVDPELFIKAGVQPDAVEGWLYTSVQVKDNNGKTTEVMKFLKPFNIQ